jgi:ubiquinone/menaquinone biosynthesis C-methylase UbiE
MKVGRVEDMAQHLLRIRGRVTTEFLPARGRVLEIGPGEVSYDRKGCEVVAINVSSRGGPQVLADAHALPFQDKAFDAVVATEVIEHVRYPFRLLREIRRVIRPGGRVLVSTPNVATPVNRLALTLFGRFPDDETLHNGQDVGHIHFFTRRSFLQAVNAEGFAVIWEGDYLFQPLPSRYLYDTTLERALPSLAKMIMLELRPVG